MSNNIRESINNNDVFNSLLGIQPTPVKTDIAQVKEVKEIKDDKPSVSETKPKQVKKASIDPTITQANYKYKDKTPNENGKYSKDKNYTITFKIDADIEQYLKNIDIITYIESIKNGEEPHGKDATTYVNDLIRADLKRLLKIADNDNDFSKWINGYNEYAKKNKIKDK